METMRCGGGQKLMRKGGRGTTMGFGEWPRGYDGGKQVGISKLNITTLQNQPGWEQLQRRLASL